MRESDIIVMGGVGATRILTSVLWTLLIISCFQTSSYSVSDEIMEYLECIGHEVKRLGPLEYPSSVFGLHLKRDKYEDKIIESFSYMRKGSKSQGY